MAVCFTIALRTQVALMEDENVPLRSLTIAIVSDVLLMRRKILVKCFGRKKTETKQKKKEIDARINSLQNEREMSFRSHTY